MFTCFPYVLLYNLFYAVFLIFVFSKRESSQAKRENERKNRFVHNNAWESGKRKNERNPPVFSVSILTPSPYWLCVQKGEVWTPSGPHQDRDLSHPTKPTNEGTASTRVGSARAVPIASTTPSVCSSSASLTIQTHTHSRTCSHIAQFYEAQKPSFIFQISSVYEFYILTLPPYIVRCGG
jgi:hypothetical protein